MSDGNSFKNERKIACARPLDIVYLNGLITIPAKMNIQEQILDGYDTLIVISLDTSYRILSINKSGRELLQKMYGVEAKTGDNILDFFAGAESKSLARKHFDRALNGERFTVTRPFEFGGRLRHFDLMYAPLLSNDKIYGISALVVDITDKKTKEEERLHANEMYRRLFVTSKDAIMTLEPPTWKFTTGNNTILDMFKVKDMDEWTSIGPWQVSPETQPDGEPSAVKAKRMIETAMTQGSHYFEWTHRRMTGEDFPATVLLTRVDFSDRQFLQATVRDITESKKIERERILNETKFQNIFEGVSEGILVAGYEEGTFLYANPAIQKMIGYTQDEMTKLSPTLVHAPEDHDLVLKALRGSKHEKTSKTIEVEFVRKDQSKFLGQAIYSFMQWDNVDCIVAFIRDITDLKKAEKEVRENQMRYQALFEDSNDAIIILKSSGEFVTGNQAVVKLFNANSLETCKNTPPHVIWPEFQPDGTPSPQKAEEVMQMALDKGSNSFEWEYKKYTGETFHASVALSRIDTEDDVFIQASIRDISDQIRTKKRLEAQNELQNLLMRISSKYINTPLADVDEAIQKSLKEIGEFVQADRSYLFEFDYINRTISNTFEWCASGIRSVMEETQNLPMNEVAEMVNPHFEGDFIYIPDTMKMEESGSKEILLEQEIKSLLTVPLMHRDNCIGFVGFDSVTTKKMYSEKEIAILKLYSDMLVNIQMRSEKEKELQKLLSTTKDQNQRLKEFSYITSHNIRASVANLIGLSEMIRVVPESEGYLDMLKITTQKLDNSISNINELINFENEHSELQKIDCSLSEAVQRVLKLTNQIIKRKDVDLKVNIEESHKIKAFPAYLDSIFHNLITNALKYGITDQSKLLEIYANQEESGTSVFIKDCGLGIDLDKYSEKMFKLGTRLHDTSDGQGLGLFMTKRQLEAMGGQIEVQSQLNSGTTFKLFFPELVHAS
ncbi:PAS domain S-box protein [Reichenbachiella sp.]|uniref:PAS domain S-box protein n=1 Tax=Reichenbachiella sp. TaxID=2184521 RepID=UPI003BB22398